MSKPWYASFKRAAVCVVASALFALSASAANLPEVSVTLSDRGGQALRVGDTVSYSLEGDSRWQIDPKVGGLKSGFLFRSGRLFTPLVPGELSLPALSVVDESGGIVATTRPLQISIASNFTEAERSSGKPPTPEPALGPVGLPFPVWIQSALALALLGVALVLVFLILRYLRKKAAAAVRKMLPKKPYDVTALERIDSVLKQNWLEKALFKPFYFSISETLKFYLGERFAFDAQESTTSELLELLKERVGTAGLDEAVVRRIEKLFSKLDLVKFADVVPSVDEAKAIQREARDLILTTKKTLPDPILKEER